MSADYADCADSKTKKPLNLRTVTSEKILLESDSVPAQAQIMKSEISRNLLRLCLHGVILLIALNSGAQAIVQIASDSGVSFFVKSDGSLWRGDMAHQIALDKAGKLGGRNFFDKLENHTPYELIASNGVTAVAMNGQHDTFFIKNDGSLWAMGNNQGGHLAMALLTLQNTRFGLCQTK